MLCLVSNFLFRYAGVLNKHARISGGMIKMGKEEFTRGRGICYVYQKAVGELVFVI